VTIAGYVDDFAPELARTDVMIVPLRHGAGTRLKILEAFAHGVPVVSTSIGASGLDVHDGRHLLIADDPNAFATACARLLRDETLRDKLANAAYDLAARRYDWSVVGQDIAKIAEETIAGAP
jgi:glycosyltransferase involved in cell wall biosynthesis